MPAPAFSVATRKIARGRASDARPPGSESNRIMKIGLVDIHKADFLFLVKHLLNIGAENRAREARIYFPISSFKTPDTFQIT